MDEEQEAAARSHRRAWSFSSLRNKRKPSDGDGVGFSMRRGLRSFSSVREGWRKGKGDDSPSETFKGEDEHDASREIASGFPEDEDAGSMMKKRISTAWSSFRGKLGRDRGLKEGELSPGEIAADVLSSDNKEKEPRFYSTQFFFEYLVVVSLKKTKDTYEPQITYQFPKKDGLVRYQKEEQEKTFKAITLFCFPEGINWEPLTEYRSETFSFVLTEVDGSRRNGYCRRLLPHGNGARPPEAYCIISSVACFGLFSKIFDEVEKRRQISMAMIYPFMQSLREAPFPAPGNTVKIKSFIPDAGTEMISLTRPLESWLEHVDFRTLFRCLSDDEVLQVFASTVLERRIVFIAEELSTLSQVIHAVTVLLTPFTWQHTLIPIVPEILIDFVDSPTPYLLGVQKRLLHLLDLTQSDLLVVDLSENREETFIAKIGDEKTLLPHKLRDEILQALKARPEKATVEELNKVVPAAFFPFFIKTVGHFNHHILRKPGEPAVFQQRNFRKALESKSTRQFVKKFVMTQMFDLFIQEVEQQPASQEGFFQKKVAEYNERMKKEKSKKTKH